MEIHIIFDTLSRMSQWNHLKNDLESSSRSTSHQRIEFHLATKPQTSFKSLSVANLKVGNTKDEVEVSNGKVAVSITILPILYECDYSDSMLIG